ncbi:MAG: NAD(P)H-dependent oxidoreductase [Anaerolineales bacterium]|jgi:putative NADPH-quinone reductase
MVILIILAHPSKKSFNYAIAQKAKKTLRELGHKIIFHDLYQEEFNPVLTEKEIPKDGEYDSMIDKYCREIMSVDGIVIIHPNWWGMPPAILKGWIDRVFRPGIAYEFTEGDIGEGVPTGMLKIQTALVFNTADTSKEREDNIFLDPLETLWKNCIFYLCGVKIFYRKIFRIMVTSTMEERENWLREVEATITKYFDKT